MGTGTPCYKIVMAYMYIYLDVVESRWASNRRAARVTRWAGKHWWGEGGWWSECWWVQDCGNVQRWLYVGFDPYRTGQVLQDAVQCGRGGRKTNETLWP